GEYLPPADRLRAIRQQIIADQAGFAKMLKNRRLKQTYGNLQQEGKLTRPPKGFDLDVPHLEYIKLKSFIVWNEIGVMSVADELEKTLAAGFRDAYPLVDWLRSVK
ncbi:MAG TPA: DUF2461 family protein, partial [Herminiimonas sp.]|nr:DUF2461 family protein [Herminiimonas sp.]